MKIPEYRPTWLQHLNQRIAMTRFGTWFFSLTLHHMDRAISRLTGGRQTAANILSGLPIFMVTTIGAKSGQPRTLPLIGVAEGGCVAFIATNWGRSPFPSWYRNMTAHPEVILSIAGETGTFVAHEAEGPEYQHYCALLDAAYPGYILYRKRLKRKAPIMVLEEKTSSS